MLSERCWRLRGFIAIESSDPAPARSIPIDLSFGLFKLGHYLLNWMLAFLAVSRPTLPSFEGNVLVSKVNSDECDANRISASAFELTDLIDQITDHAIDLF